MSANDPSNNIFPLSVTAYSVEHSVSTELFSPAPTHGFILFVARSTRLEIVYGSRYAALCHTLYDPIGDPLFLPGYSPWQNAGSSRDNRWWPASLGRDGKGDNFQSVLTRGDRCSTLPSTFSLGFAKTTDKETKRAASSPHSRLERRRRGDLNYDERVLREKRKKGVYIRRPRERCPSTSLLNTKREVKYGVTGTLWSHCSMTFLYSYKRILSINLNT
ncbi:uncharacterized protein LOC143179647 [Calliopsis andreniformis]|uniref:uncharacterized protein LOC143179647 n=1 Tax=Calliopsis andreniformis TaxID=337506 RepID=UPI003FCEB26E